MQIREGRYYLDDTGEVRGPSVLRGTIVLKTYRWYVPLYDSTISNIFTNEGWYHFDAPGQGDLVSEVIRVNGNWQIILQMPFYTEVEKT